MADQMPAGREATAGSPRAPRGPLLAGEDSEIICIVRSKSNPRGPSETFVLDRPSPELIHRLSQEYYSVSPGVARAAARPAVKNAFRAQSADK